SAAMGNWANNALHCITVCPDWRLYARSPEPSCSHEMPAKEPTAQAPVRHKCSGVRRVNEAAASHVYAHVIDVPRVDSKEEQVAGKQVPKRYGSGRALLLRRRAWDLDSNFLVGVDRKPAAIEAAVIRAAEPVRRPDETLCDG